MPKGDEALLELAASNHPRSKSISIPWFSGYLRARSGPSNSAKLTIFQLWLTPSTRDKQSWSVMAHSKGLDCSRPTQRESVWFQGTPKIKDSTELSWAGSFLSSRQLISCAQLATFSLAALQLRATVMVLSGGRWIKTDRSTPLCSNLI